MKPCGPPWWPWRLSLRDPLLLGLEALSCPGGGDGGGSGGGPSCSCDAPIPAHRHISSKVLPLA
eukprot:2215756-Karenia_brevis.AAC.1